LMSLGAPWLAKRAKRPLLVVWGTADTNVDREDFETWRQALSGTGPAHRFVAIDGMTHALNSAEPGSPGGVSTTLAQGLSDQVARFIEESRSSASKPTSERRRANASARELREPPPTR